MDDYHVMIKLLFALLLPALLLGTGVQASGDAISGPDAQSWGTAALPPTLDMPGDPTAAERAPAHPRLDDSLRRLAAPGADRSAVAGASGLRLQDGLVQVQIAVGAGREAAARSAVAAAGGQVTGAIDGALQAWLPPERLAALAAQSPVEYVRSPETVVPAELDAGATLSEGVAAANAGVWHNAGWRGQGVRVAVIDAGFVGYKTAINTGDLPADVSVKNFVDFQTDDDVDQTTQHGTACAEIVHDMAPDASLFLLKISTDIDLNEAIDYAISQDVDVISTSLTFLNVTPGDGTGRFATMAQKARDAGILWVTAAGNYREGHWSGTFSDVDGDGYHEFAPGVEVNVFGPGNNTAYEIPANTALTASIRWDDWTAITEDFRLSLVRYNPTTRQFEIVSSSNNPQTGGPGQRPTERTTYLTSGDRAIYGVVIQRVSGGRAVHFHLQTPNRELDRRVPAMSLGSLADVEALLTVGATSAAAPFNQERYSSEGPTNGPGGVPGGGRLKPDMAAFANVSTGSHSPDRFSGTSAATPHVAGAAAQVWSAHPHAQPDDVRDFLQSRAIDQGDPGADARFGHGRLHLGAPPAPIVYDYHLFAPVTVSQ